MSGHNDVPFSRPAWTAFGISLVSALVSLGFSTAALHLIDKSDPTYAYVLFNLARTLALVIGFGVVARTRSHASLVLLTGLMAFIQLLDGVVGAIDGNLMQTLGPWGIAVISFVAFFRLLRAERTDRDVAVAAAAGA